MYWLERVLFFKMDTWEVDQDTSFSLSEALATSGSLRDGFEVLHCKILLWIVLTWVGLLSVRGEEDEYGGDKLSSKFILSTAIPTGTCSINPLIPKLHPHCQNQAQNPYIFIMCDGLSRHRCLIALTMPISFRGSPSKANTIFMICWIIEIT